MDPISCYIFWKICFKYLEAKQKMWCVDPLSTGSFLKLVLIFLKCFECFPKMICFSSSTKILNSRWTETKNFPKCFFNLFIFFTFNVLFNFSSSILSQALINNPEPILIALLLFYCFQYLFRRHSYKNFFREAKRKLTSC